jgi:hypothetical protein
MANKTNYKGTGFGMTKAPNPPANQPKATATTGKDLRTGSKK